MSQTQTSRVGNISEMKVMMAYIEAGFAISLPFGGGAPYDLIVDTGIQLLKVQVKTGRLRNGCILFPTMRFSGHTLKARKYHHGDVDLFAVYCPQTDEIYIWPFGDMPTAGSLRREETRNGQQCKIRWARDYSFVAHVESLRKEMELRGFEPLTS